MSTICPDNIKLILDDENIGDSLNTINENFENLKNEACTILQELDTNVATRTFFYYGPNAPTESEAGSWEQDNLLNRPSNSTIENFVNSSSQLNLTSISQINDIAYVIYQKTGWLSQTNTYIRGGSGTVPFQRTVQVQVVRGIGIGRRRVTWEPQVQTYYVGYSWSANINDTYNTFMPVFIIYRLTYNGVQYSVDSGFPKYNRASTASTNLWNLPQNWTTY